MVECSMPRDGYEEARASCCSGRWQSSLISFCTAQVPGRNEDGSIRRAGVPQFRQLHTMLARGLIEFENIIPGFVKALQTAGAVAINFLTDTCGVWILSTRWSCYRRQSRGTDCGVIRLRLCSTTLTDTIPTAGGLALSVPMALAPPGSYMRQLFVQWYSAKTRKP